MPSSPFLNPYNNKTFFEFFLQFFVRVWELMSGQLAFQQLAADEIQLLVLMGVAASSALVGTFLVLRRMTMLANSLSHTILMGIVLAYFFTLINPFYQKEQVTYIAPMQAMLIASLITGFLTAFLTQFLTKTGQLQEDASVGLVFTSFFALGVTLVTILTRDAHVGTEAVMGNADALHITDSFWVYLVLAFNLILFIIFYKEFELTTFDPNLALALGFSPALFNYLLMAQVSVTTITAFRAIGVILVLAFMTGPVLTARLLTHRLKHMLVWAVGIGMLSAFSGVALTRHVLTIYGIALSTSGVVVCVILIVYLLVMLIAPERGVIAKWRHRKKAVKQSKIELSLP
ncbi:metal ABC transporter permease [Candidatus Protochlamydia phocaeensis]|uniref:metal ABC transporter permease n=1 Tax=Candidatus Protochlamydia phocaeensis TaxID=1414722 RepID=UPI0008381A7C|nr:metal ABC transporter permease [Candidatus Protochlamydia phocaeensis]